MKIWIIVILALAAMVSFIIAASERIKGNQLDAIYDLIQSFYLFYQANVIARDFEDDKS